jgi:hypothetical protein
VSCGISLAVEQRPPERHRRRARAGKDGRRAEITGPQVTHSTVTIAAVAPMSGGASFRKRTPQAPAPFAMAGLQLSLIQGVLDDRVSGNSKEHHRIEQSTCPVKGSAGRSSVSITTDHSYRLDPTEQPTGVSWGAIAAGAVVAAALSLALIALGLGLGLSAISPWSGSGASATTFKIGSGIYLAVVAVLASTVGGYLAARAHQVDNA